MFNIPIRKERDLQVEDFVVPACSKTFEDRPFGNKNFVADENNTKPQMIWVISSDTMRNGEYFTGIKVMDGVDYSQEMLNEWNNTEVRMYKKSDWKIERNPTEYYYYSLDADDRGRYYKSFGQVAAQVNHAYRKKILPRYDLEMDRAKIRAEWTNIRAKAKEDGYYE